MDFREELGRRILVLDGAMGSMIQSFSPESECFRFECAPEGIDLKGDNECLNLSNPEIIKSIHLKYIEAGADIIETNSFGANRISQSEYGCSDYASDMAFAAARIAREAVSESGRPVFVAGSVGPTGKSLTLARDMDNPALRDYDFDAMSDIFMEQIDALLRGGVDFILVETCFDSLIAKAAISALGRLGNPVPLVISATVSDRSGRTLTGQTLEAFYHSVRYAPTLAAFGINCALGALHMVHLVEEISAFSSLPLIFYPNAGLPDEQGHYNDTPDDMAAVIGSLASQGLLNIVGGCCGTTPAHIAAMTRAIQGKPCRVSHSPSGILTVSGLEPVAIDRQVSFTNIGERTNVAGSRKFARLIANGQYEEALQVASAQIEGGANIIDINMDDAMLDSSVQMRTFLRYISTDPSVAKAAVMIDSSHFDTIVEGLKNAQGKSIVNSISLKDGEEEFLRRASIIKSFGAAMVVMAFDEEGQAETYRRKIEICSRSYQLLTQKAGVAPCDIIFDVNVLSVGTGIPEHSRFGIDFIEAVRWIKSNLPGALTSGGISNLSFAFRGNNKVREAMHSVFLYHAIAAGLDMAIVNPQMLQIYDEIESDLLLCIEDVILNRRADATPRLVELASRLNSEKMPEETPKAAGEESSAEERLLKALMKGDSSTLTADVLECLEHLKSPLAVIEGPLVNGMEKVGNLFAEGKMFLPQIVRSAKIMKDAVAVLQPYINDEGNSGNRPRIVIATVKGDVHDIGKNIVSTVLQCSGFEIIDLGVMVPVDDIINTAVERKADIIAVSGLITPSLYRMEEICVKLSSMNSDIPLFVGGAAASAIHTAVKLAPLYDNVHYRADASATAVMAKRYLASPEEFRESDRAGQERLRKLYSKSDTSEESADRTIAAGLPSDSFLTEPVFHDIEITEFPASDFKTFFDWKLFNVVCGIKPDDTQFHDEALALLDSGQLAIRHCARFISCNRDGDDLVGDTLRLPMLRQQGGDAFSLADYFLPVSSGKSTQLGLFSITVMGPADDSSDLLLHAVKVTLAETQSMLLRKKLSSAVPEGFKVILPAMGYSCCPDHSLKRDVLDFLPDIGITLSDSCAMMPEASICGLVIAHKNATYGDIRSISAEQFVQYSAKRHFTAEESALFLKHLLG